VRKLKGELRAMIERYADAGPRFARWGAWSRIHRSAAWTSTVPSRSFRVLCGATVNSPWASITSSTPLRRAQTVGVRRTGPLL